MIKIQASEKKAPREEVEISPRQLPFQAGPALTASQHQKRSSFSAIDVDANPDPPPISASNRKNELGSQETRNAELRRRA